MRILKKIKRAIYVDPERRVVIVEYYHDGKLLFGKEYPFDFLYKVYEHMVSLEK